jgi:hypothetical protein
VPRKSDAVSRIDGDSQQGSSKNFPKALEPADKYRQSMKDDKDHKVSDGGKTPSVSFEPIKEVPDCKAFYDKSEAIKRIKCYHCDLKGNVITEYGQGRCLEWRG